MNANLRSGIHLSDGKGNHIDLDDAETKRATTDTSLRTFATSTKTGLARTRSGSIVTARSQEEADRIATEIDNDKSPDIGIL